MTGSKIIVALDLENIQEVRRLVSGLHPSLCRLKIGPVLFTRYGPALIEELMKQGYAIFLDLKFHDIPNTVAEACKAAVDLGVWMISLHISGGRAMLDAVHKIIRQSHALTKPLLIGITVLTSFDEQDLHAIGINAKMNDQVLRLAQLGMNCGLDGVVSSAQEVRQLRKTVPQALLVTPGIRLKEDKAADQKRVFTPKEAIEQGSDFLVIGRSITHAENPVQRLETIIQEIQKLDEPA